MEDLHGDDPAVIGGYRLVSRIGTGGMGIVYLAEDSAGRRVALKLVRNELADDAGFRSRFRREVEAGQRVGGICTARYLDADLDSDHPYLVTEYIDAGNLFDYVTANGPLQGDQLVGLAVGLAESLVAMAASGVIHRDLKPSNVLMAPSGPKVVDFGISHAADGTALTQTGLIMGSPGWMAPEQALGQATTPAIDVFAWGATVAFASTGRSPFGDGRPDAVLYRVVHEQPDLDGLDPRLMDTVRQALRKEPHLRPSADQLLVEVVKAAMAGSLPPGGSVAMTTVVLDRTWHRSPPVDPAIQEEHREVKGHRRWALVGIVSFVIIAAAVATGLIAESHSNDHVPAASASRIPRSTAPPTTKPSAATASPATTAAAPSAAVVSAVLPMIVCPTSYGDPPSSTVVLPSTVSESVPSDLTAQLAVYTDQEGDMKLLGPTGWTCSANIGADGSGGVQVYPTGTSDPNSEPFQASSAKAIVGSQSGGCVGCAVSQASPLFPAANTLCQSQFSGDAGACPSAPDGESTEPIETGVVGFLDPPGVAGDGNPSGGPYPANGVMTFSTSSYTTSYIDTCTLPASQHALCTAALDNFAQTYGSQ